MAASILLEIFPKNIRPTLGKIINKPWDDINYIESNRKKYQKHLHSSCKMITLLMNLCLSWFFEHFNIEHTTKRKR